MQESRLTNDGVEYMAEVIIHNLDPFELVMQIYVDDADVEPDDNVSSFTPAPWVSPTVSGLDPVLWFRTGGTRRDTLVYPSIDFYFNPYSGSPITVFGYFVYVDSTDIILWGGRLDTPYVIPFTGGILPVSTTFVLGECPLT